MDWRRRLALSAIGGIAAGIAFILFETTMAVALGMSLTAPLRMISAIVLGPSALTPSVPTSTAVFLGLVVHLLLSAVFGAVFGLILLAIPTLASTYESLLLASSVYGLLLWILNFQIIGRAFFPWFTAVNQLVFGVIAHTLFYGAALGIYLAQVVPAVRRDRRL